MIKGCEKKIIFIEGTETSPFENAYFVLRKDSENCCDGGDNIIKEANRIISERIPSNRKRRRFSNVKKSLYSALVFVAGFLLGVSSTLIVWLSLT